MTTILRRTPLYEAHVRLGGRMVPFAGWEMPVQYQGILAEVRAVRTTAGIFDVSHMGRIAVEGPDAIALLAWVHTGDVGEQMAVGRARYGLLCNEQGGIIDDGIVYRLGQERFLLVANASNTAQVLAWLTHWRDARFPTATVEDQTDLTAMIALQGPGALAAIARISDFDPSAVRPYRCARAFIQGRSLLVARTGYTGEDGVEVMPSAEDAAWLWGLLMEQGAAPCGLGARDVLRLEAALPLHGADIGPATNPIEAGLERFVVSGHSFCGADAVRQAQASGPTRRLVGFECAGEGPIPRHGSTLVADGQVVGEVTSGGYSPTLDRTIGLGYVPVRLASPGTRLHVDIRGKLAEAAVVSLPFYSRRK